MGKNRVKNGEKDLGEDRVKNGEKDLRARLREINRNLDRVKLRIRAGRFYIRGMFSPRPGETENVRTELATGCSANPAGLRVAKMKAEDINLQLLNDRFDWQPFLKGRLKHLKPASTVGEWIPPYEEYHWQKNDRSNPNKQNSFKKNYQMFFKWLPPNEELTVELLESVVLTRYPEPGKRSRQLCVMAYAALATFAELPTKEIAELRQLGKGYSPKSVDPRTLPTDNEILDIWSCISDPGWRWIYAAIALYGLRSHEVFRCFTDRLQEKPPILEIQEETKTGRRQAYPCPGDGWGEIMAAIRHPVYPSELKLTSESGQERSNNDLGDSVGQYLRNRKFPFTPLDFRHAYARRMYRKGFDSGFSAKSMGHSRDVHERIYSAWWGDEPYLERYKKIMGIEESDGTQLTEN